MPRQSSLPPRDPFGKFTKKPETTSTDTSPDTPPRQSEPSTSSSTLDITEAFAPDYETTPRPNRAHTKLQTPRLSFPDPHPKIYHLGIVTSHLPLPPAKSTFILSVNLSRSPY
ncbi:hypothetical protein EDB92DRAFT_1957434 [Lactarius akahatsu]|uniref:Uncharacterized protein n=1 Tax=Lactarius akahatsu TaxID=416441 RepID=A0AAD4L2T7_9AGAM|nr:hypothetical protein EDB92DRAFT_1957434 [Lactarius akahatsu]